MNWYVLTALALNLNQNRKVLWSLSVPRLEWCEFLETVALRVNCYLYACTVFWGRLECVLTGVVTTRREFVTSWGREFEWLAISTLERVRERVEGEITSKSHSSDEIRRSDESVGGGVSIVTASEVTVVGGDDCESSFI